MRNNALDAVKLLACFFIMVVHVGNYNELPALYGDLFRVSSRWALPFFFLSSGYLMGMAKELDVGRKLNRLVSILFYSSIIYIPIIYRAVGGNIEKLIGKVISADTLHGGTFFHLWFISALILGVVLTNYMLKNVSLRWSLFIAFLIIIGCWYGDLIKSLGYKIYIFYPLRTLIAFSLVYLGFILAKTNALSMIKNSISVFVIILGIMAMITEVYLMHRFYGADMNERQFPLMCVPVSVFLLALSVNINIKDNLISRLGKDFSLGVYLIHPFLLYIAVHDVGYFIAQNSSVKLVSCFVISIFILIFAKRYVPLVYRKINGIGVH
ncbi:acyltransferase family protein [Rahnella victoriana]|uniref:Acyltransferase n=1 Tax=Rahnella victoriana TaxID=1510570 RepID=A0ABS0DQT1_9GAMM|nr:acyltransferase [Rahnella victoriana]MBF7956256.1 acyltransferase [Rahnella victoriana]TBX33960.1 acyltransferase [Rahnella victoriana]